MDADLPPNDEFEISMISGNSDYFTLSDGVIELLRPLNVPAGILETDYTIGN